MTDIRDTAKTIIQSLHGIYLNMYMYFSPVGPAVKDSLLYKLRWVTLGYHYDWTNKLYHKERHSPFPTDLSLLSRFILASACGFPGFRAEAAIVNYYHFESTLSGHTDHSESDLTFPLISIRYQLVWVYSLGMYQVSIVSSVPIDVI